MSTKNIINLIVLAVLLALSAFFSSAETAMTTVNKLRIKSLAESGNSRAVIMEKILAHSAKMLSAILIGNNIVNLYASSLATSLAIDVFGSSSVGIATGILTLLVLIFGEITPKNLAAVRAEKLSLSYAPVIWALMWIMTPVISVTNALSGLLMRLFHATPGRKDVITEDDLRTFVDASRDDGAIQVEEHKMINNVFDLDESCARDIMVPGVDMVCINEDDSTKKSGKFTARKNTPACLSTVMTGIILSEFSISRISCSRPRKNSAFPGSCTSRTSLLKPRKPRIF